MDLKKRNILLAFILILALALTACTAGAEESATVVEEASSSDTDDETVEAEAAISDSESEEATESETETVDDSKSSGTYNLTETGQGFCYNADGENIDCPAEGEAFYGQDAQFTGNEMSYTDNGDGTITDNVTGLLWQQATDSGSLSWYDAQTYCVTLELAGQDNWRMPSLKELFSISNFSAGWPYLDTTYFDLVGTDSVSKDEQYWSSDHYVGYTVEGQYDAAFGVNHATGHIKAYAASVSGPMGKYVRCVVGDDYLINDFVDNSDGTITDNATGMMWTQADSGFAMEWEQALTYAQEMNEANYLGYSDWRLPDIKELQSIADYDYAPDAEDEAYDGPALDPMFIVSETTNEAGTSDYPYYWSSTSARFQAGGDFYYAWYLAAGRAVNSEGVDFHGAGAVRFDAKAEGGPAGEDGERYENYVMLVRGGDVTETPDGDVNASDTSLASELISGDDAGAPPQGEGEGQQPGGQPGGMGEPDFAAAAETLGITEEELIEIFETYAPQGQPPDFTGMAEALGITEEALMEALGMQGGGQPGGQPGGGGG